MGSRDPSGSAPRQVTPARPLDGTSHTARSKAASAHIDIIGLGPAGADFVTRHTLDVIADHARRYVRTEHHPSAHIVGDAVTLDHHYVASATFDEVYRNIVEELVAAALEHGRILYAVPGSPLILERTVQLLLDETRVSCTVHPAMSFLDLVWSRLRIDPIDSAVRLIDAHEFATAAAGDAGAMLVAHCHANWVLSDVKLAAEDTMDLSNDDVTVTVLHHLGLEDEQVLTVPWSEIDRCLEADHLTSIYIPGLRAPVGRELVAFHELARRLRRECPWDRDQTHASLTTYLLEETYEVVDALLALDPNDPSTDEDLVEELGDLLYQIEFHAAIAEQEGRFTMADIARSIHDKMVRRHPHVFGGGETGIDSGDANSLDAKTALVASWDEIKKAEKAAKKATRPDLDDGPFAGIVDSTGSLAYAADVVKRSSTAGHPIAVPEDIAQSIAQISDLGLHLMYVVAECRRRQIDPEVVLRASAHAQRDAVTSVTQIGPGEAGQGITRL